MTASDQFGDETVVGRQLRIGLLLDSLDQPKWVHHVIREICASDIAKIVVVIQGDGPSEPKGPFWHRLARRWRRLLYLVYSRVDAWWFGSSGSVLATKSIEPLVTRCSILRLRCTSGRRADCFDVAELTEIVGYELDVALCFGFRRLAGRGLKIARHGVWAYYQGDRQVNRDEPIGVWEVMEGAPVTEWSLQAVTEESEGERVLYRWVTRTDRRSAHRNRESLWNASTFVMRKLRDLYDGVEAFGVLSDPTDQQCYRPGHYGSPNKLATVRPMLKFVGRFARDRLEKLVFFEQWSLAYSFPEGSPVLDRFKPITPPKDCYWADPFPVQVGSSYYIFIEEFDCAISKGHVAMIEMDRNGAWKMPVIVLKRDYHLSYPFVFEWNSSYYMIPESSENRSIELFRCASFPDRWELEQVLMTGVNAVDATLACIEGRWWMFVAMAATEVLNVSDLHLFHAETPLGPWRPHRRNPVKSDVRSARPAGRLFLRDGDLFRPAQDCSVRYGYAIAINRILRLDTDHYQEVEVSRIVPEPSHNQLGTHTLNSSGDLTVIDRLLRRPRYRHLLLPTPRFARRVG